MLIKISTELKHRIFLLIIYSIPNWNSKLLKKKKLKISDAVISNKSFCSLHVKYLSTLKNIQLLSVKSLDTLP